MHRSSASFTPMLDKDKNQVGIGFEAIPLDDDEPRNKELLLIRSFSQRLGIYSISIIIGGSISILASGCFLLFLWVGNEQNITWRELLQFATRAVTLSSLVIRTSVALQAGVCTAMLAAVALESGVALRHAAAVSAMRQGLNTSPHDIALRLFGCRRGKSRILPALASALVVTTLASQFASTALISDFRPRVIQGTASSKSNLAYGMDDNSAMLFVFSKADYLTARPQSFPSFAEDRPEGPPPTLPDGLHSTGPTLRALLPFPDAKSRSTLSTYRGKATVVDATVTCVRPEVSFDIELLGDTAVFNGTIGPEIAVPGAPGGKWRRHFSMAAMVGWAIPILQNDEWLLTLARLDAEVPEASTGLFSYFSTKTDVEHDAVGQVYIIANSTGKWNEFYPAWSPKNTSTSQEAIISPHGEWTNFAWKNISISISLCYTSFDNLDLDVVVSSETNRTEPSLTWNSTETRFDTSQVRRQLALGSDPDRRNAGYMSVKEASNSSHSNNGSWRHRNDSDTWMSGGFVSSYYFATIIGDTFKNDSNEVATTIPAPGMWPMNQTFALCVNCDTFRTHRGGADSFDENVPGRNFSLKSVHAANIAIFQDTLKETGHPSIALQSLLTLRFSATYYDYMNAFNLYSAAEYSLYTTIAGPGIAYLGITAVLSTLAVHLMLVFVITMLFHKRSRWSLLGSSWQSVSQTACLTDSVRDAQQKADSPQALRKILFETSTASTDREVESLIRRSGWNGSEVILAAPNEGTDRAIGMQIRQKRAHGTISEQV